MSDIERRYSTISDNNKFTSELLDAKIKKTLLNKSDISGFIMNSDLDKKKKKIATLATKAELKSEEDKIEKLQTYDSSLLICQSYFGNDGSQNFLICQPI